MKKKFFVFAVLIVLPTSLCAHSHSCGQCQEEKKEFEWTRQKTEFANILVQVAGPGQIHNYIQATGRVIMHPDHVAYVIPKVKGSVCQVHKNIGDSVEQGDSLAVIESREIVEAKADYLSALKQNTIAQSLWDKEKSLKGISAEQDCLHAELAASQANIQLHLAIQHLCSLGFTAEQIHLIDKEDPSVMRFYEIRSPIKGQILQRNLTLGESIDSSMKAFTVGSMEKIWVELNIPQQDLRYIDEGHSVEITSEGKQAKVKICQFNPLISEETRTATVIAELENSKEEWSAGEFIKARVCSDTFEAPVVVPLSAIQTIDGEQCVFIEEGESFAPCVVRLGKMDNEYAQIISGLPAGASYAACNTFCLKAEYEKEQGEHTH